MKKMISYRYVNRVEKSSVALGESTEVFVRFVGRVGLGTKVAEIEPPERVEKYGTARLASYYRMPIFEETLL